jgi:sirohydrochlorin cobaltochelatase
MAGAGRASRKAKAAAPDLTETALLLCAHGRSDAATGAPTAGFVRPPSSEDRRATTRAPEAHAAALRKRRLFACVEICALRGDPAPARVLAGIEAERVFLVPLLMADGYTSRVVLPAMLAEANAPVQRVTLCRPVGLSPALAPLAAAEAARLCTAHGWRPGETAVIVAGHGTGRHERSGVSAEVLAGRMAALRRFEGVTAAFLDQPPTVEAALRVRRPSPCAVVGFFIDEGRHSTVDIPRLIAAEHPGAAYSGALGAVPAFSDVILATVREAAGSV